ncbi:hypothetical protein OBBRIDRAFT_798655 [Obba rivulosa]|uniref:Ubiquinol-cytochrome c chaperone domain-containing protein n=1 Tax=Obba rivulosa TaxID=1052685 RepID=A0A8E2DJN5_9APHY|nr:hypothetical protein OBBRIDRAFT_798655 [Obba rivulosa]
MNLHVWLLTVRLRALPPPHGMNHIQGLIDHFFLDVEDRVRRVLQPVGPDSMAPAQNLEPYTQPTDFYTVANGGMRVKARGRAPERLVTRQMKVFKEQYFGLGMALDLGLVKGDAEMAGAVWRNFLGARGARGILYQSDADPTQPYFRRSVNLLGGKVEQGGTMTEEQLRAEEAKDDGSGVHDYAPAEADKYVAYPERMATLVAYVRRELKRLDAIPDEVVMGPGKVGSEAAHMDQLKFGRVRDGNPLLDP